MIICKHGHEKAHCRKCLAEEPRTKQAEASLPARQVAAYTAMLLGAPNTAVIDRDTLHRMFREVYDAGRRAGADQDGRFTLDTDPHCQNLVEALKQL